MEAQDNEVMSPKDVAEYLHIGINKAYSLMKVKGFPLIRIGNTYRVFKSDLIEYLKNGYGIKIKTGR